MAESQAEDAVSALRSMGIYEPVARRKVKAAMEKVAASWKVPPNRYDFIQMACDCL